jgi:hypothetical protein
MKLTGENRGTLGKTCPSATLSTTNPTWTDRGSNPGHRSARPATNRLSHGTAANLFYNAHSHYVAKRYKYLCSPSGVRLDKFESLLPGISAFSLIRHVEAKQISLIFILPDH